MWIIGVDTGLAGGIAVLDADNGIVISLRDMPVIEDKSKSIYFVPEIVRIFKNFSIVEDFVVLEKTYPMPRKIGGSASANWFLGGGYFLFIGILETLGFRYETIDPRVWQRYFFSGLRGTSKEKSFQVASRLFKDVDLVEKKGKKVKILDGRCDALLIAEYQRRRLVGSKAE